MDSWSNHLQRPETQAESRLYSHLLQQVKELHPSDAVALFRQLLIEGRDYPYPSVQRNLDWILQSGFIEHDFRFILNRSCYIYINSWFATAGHRVYIPELIDSFEELPSSPPRTPTEQQLRRLLAKFVESPQYKALRCLSLAICAEWDYARKEPSTDSLVTTVRRYPYIYRHQLLTRDSSFEQRKTVRAMQREAQKQLDIKLSRYSAYLKFGSADASINSANPEINPTLLSSEQLNYALHQFTGKVDGTNTHRDLAKQFLTYSQWVCSYRDFKHDLYDYLTPAVRSRFGKHHFNQRLATFLSETFAYYDASVPDDALIAATCKKLLNFLVVESPRCPDHMNFIDLIGNLGATLTMALLLKIILLCRQAKPWLERRLSILFNHYSLRPKGDVLWLIDALENANVALSTNFSTSLIL